MASTDPTDVPTTDPSEDPSVDAFGPPHDQAISESLQLWILIPGLVGLILVGEKLISTNACMSPGPQAPPVYLSQRLGLGTAQPAT